jgi:hypothetical protein
MTNFDPTTNRIPFKLLTSEEQDALKAWPHGWEVCDLDWWRDRPHPIWSPNAVYRGKPEPVVTRVYHNVYANGESDGRHRSVKEALEAAKSDSIGMIYIEIVDEKIKGVSVVEGVEK